MSNALTVSLALSPAPAHWGENNLLSYHPQGATIHLKTANEFSTIQKAARLLDNQGIKHVVLEGDWHIEQQWSFYLGFINAKKLGGVTFVDNEHRSELLARAKVSNWLREVTNGSPDSIYPESLAEKAAEFVQSFAPEAVSYNLIKGDALLEHGWIGIHSVGRASSRPPVLLTLDFNPSKQADTPVAAALVGKGITFDSGGYSIKSSEGMVTMKCDMGGAATVTAALALAISRGFNKRVKLFLCCAENLIAGNAYKLGDILKYKNGTTVEIVNTDAEGRLVLADGLQAASETGAPLIIDAATLTGAAMTAVGTEYNALFALDKALAAEALAFASAENELLWPLPLEKWHQNSCPSAYADTANSRPVKGGGAGGASNAAGFLSRFVANEGQGWLHFDIAAAFQNSATSTWAAGATGAGIRTIARLLQEKA